MRCVHGRSRRKVKVLKSGQGTDSAMFETIAAPQIGGADFTWMLPRATMSQSHGGVISVVGEASDQQQFLLATLPSSREQNRAALGIVVALVVAVAITLPFTTIQLPVVVAFIPALQTALLICFQ
jgi:hypothetical protein